MLLQSVVECRRGVKTPSDLWITEEHLATSLVFNEKKRRGVGAGQPALKLTHIHGRALVRIGHVHPASWAM